MNDVWARVADRIRAIAKESSPVLERYRVRSATPLRLEQVDGDEVLDEADADVTVGENVRQYHANVGLTAGDHVRVVRDPDGFHAVDVVTTGDNP
jgi:hypothetical protein